MDYLIHILIVVGIYIILSSSLNLIAGYAGMLSVAHAAFYGIGAYVVALMALRLHTPALLNIGCAVLVCGLSGALVGIPSLRVRDDYFVVATFAFQIIVFGVLNNLESLTGGTRGLMGIPRPVLFGWAVSSEAAFLLLAALCCVMSVGLSRQIVNSPFGRVLRSMREDEVFTQTLGKNVAAFKIAIFVIGAGMAATAGALYAYYTSFIDPKSFTLMESVFILSIVIIGGSGSLWGPLIGATILVFIPELLRFVGMPTSVSENLRQILYGVLLIVFVIWRPQGIAGERVTPIKCRGK